MFVCSRPRQSGRGPGRKYLRREASPARWRRVWHAGFTPDDKLLFTANGITGDVSVADVSSRRVLKSIPVDAFAWDVAVPPKRTAAQVVSGRLDRIGAVAVLACAAGTEGFEPTSNN